MGDYWDNVIDHDALTHYEPKEMGQPIPMRVKTGMSSSAWLLLWPDGRVTWEQIFDRPSNVNEFLLD